MTQYEPEYCKRFEEFEELYVAARAPQIKLAYNSLYYIETIQYAKQVP